MAYDVGKGLGGAGKGASTGAAIGSVVPVLGTAVGGVIGGAVGLIGGFFGNNPSPAEIAAQEYLRELESIGIPPKEALRTVYERFQSQGQLTPKMEQAFAQTDSELTKIEADPALRDAQTKVLETLKREGDQQGMTLEDRIATTTGQLEAATEARGRNQAIQQQLQARGMAGSGQELAMKMANEQAAAQRNALASAQISADARKRALDSVLRRGELAGDVRTQDFSEKSKIATAQDAINKFNIENKQGVGTRNTEATNDAAFLQWKANQDLANKNTVLSNREEDNRVAVEKDYNARQIADAARRAKAKSGEIGAAAARQTASGNTISGGIETVGGIADQILKSKKEDEDDNPLGKVGGIVKDAAGIAAKSRIA